MVTRTQPVPVNCLQGSRRRKTRLKKLKSIRGLRGWEVLETAYYELFLYKFVMHLDISRFQSIQY